MSVSTVKQALNIIQLEPIAAVFIDLRMPEVPCGEVIDWIRDVNPSIPLFGLADTPSQLEILMCREKALKGYFTKPFSAVALARAAEGVLQQKNPHGSSDIVSPGRSGQ